MGVLANPEVLIVLSGETRDLVVGVDAPHLKSLKIVRQAGDMADSFELQVLDSVANELEYNLLSSKGGEISVKYRGSTENTGGTAGADYNKFNGFVTSMNSSWYNDRNMLTLKGIIGISIQDKYEKMSMNWNKVPKFDWSKVFSDYKASGLSADRNEEDSGWEVAGDAGSSFGNSLLSGLSYAANGLWGLLKGAFTGDWSTLDGLGKDNTLSYYSPFSSLMSYYMTESFGAPQKNYDALKDFMKKKAQEGLKQDSAGNFYFPKSEYSNNRNINKNKKDLETNKSYYVKQSGDHIIPIKPSELVKLVCCGGKFSDLLMKDEDFDETKFCGGYGGTSFYNGDAAVSILDWIWIQVWFDLMGSFEGIGLTAAEIEETDMVEEDFSQNAQSYTDFLLNTVAPVSKVEIHEYGEEVVKPQKYKERVEYTDTKYVYTNFMFYVDENKGAHFKRVSAKDIYNNAPVADYYYYGTPVSGSMPHNRDSYGILQSLSAEQDVLTAMISNGTDYGGDISTIDLVYGKEHGKSKDTVDPSSDKIHPFSDWGKVNIRYQGSSTTDTATEVALANVQEQASSLAYKATATIVGTCKLNPLDLISITVVAKDSANAGGAYKHHTSGNYLVQKITESITNSQIMSELSLIKNANNMGATTPNVTVTTTVKHYTQSYREGTERAVEEVLRYYMEVDNRYNGANWKIDNSDYLKEWSKSENKVYFFPSYDSIPTPSDEAFEIYNTTRKYYQTSVYKKIMQEEYGYDPQTKLYKETDDLTDYTKFPPQTFSESGLPNPTNPAD